jgi:hypothetical protein
MLTFSDWENLSDSSRLEQISALMISSHYANEKIYRPIKMLPEVFYNCDKYILQNYPNGEYISFSNQSITYDNYKFLYHWITGGCMECFNHSLVWDMEESAILYYCRYCGVKKQIYTLSDL